MYIPFIYVLFIAEAMLIFLALSIIFGIAAYRFANRKNTTVVATDEKPIINLGSSYLEHLDTEIMKNQAQKEIDAHSEHEDSAQQNTDSKTETKHSKLLKLRDMFLHTERTAAEHADNDIQFWQQVYDGMDRVLDHFKIIEHETIVAHEETVDHKKEVDEKVFYIETAGKKIDGEVNRLKDIIFDQENTLSDMIKALKKAEEEHHDINDSEIIAELRNQVGNFERQIRDSRTCMEVLELENTRLQDEIHKIEAGQTITSESSTDENSIVDVKVMREMIEKQEHQIHELTETIDGLKLSAEQSEKIKQTLNSFVRSSQEMMGCITILEEENERLLAISSNASTSSEDEQTLKTQIRKLEEEIIKKDVAFAKLQDEFSSMEKEYLAMYNAIHGDKG